MRKTAKKTSAQAKAPGLLAQMERTIAEGRAANAEALRIIQGGAPENGKAPSTSTAETNWIRNAVHVMSHLHGAELVTLEVAAHRLYVPEAPRNKVGRMATWSEMKRVFERTKGQPFVLDRAFPGMPDPGPLFVWQSLWWFAGAPEKGEKPTWKPNPSWGYVATSTECRPGRCLMRVRDEVAKFRRLTTRPPKQLRAA